MESLTAVPDTSNPPGELYCTACEKTFHIGERCPTDGTRLIKLKARIDPFLGRDLDGRYTVLEKLGAGGMGAVYRAEQHSVDREVAIKVVHSTLVSEPEVIKRFLREAKLASRLSHPNAVGVLDFGQTEDGVFYLVMELVTGRTLDDMIKAERILRPERVVRIAVQICDALEGAHAISIIHRDLKPSNVMLMASGRDIVKVLDFGLAKSTSPDATSTTMTGAGAVVGTPAFMPPELATGEPCDARSDLYSLGVMLYLMGSGRLPFIGESVHELLALHASDDPAPPMTGVPAKLASVIDKLLCKRPEDRYQSAVEARTALEESLTVSTPPPVLVGSDTNPSIGPFPATSSQFAHMQTQTPLPPSLVAAQTGRKKPSTTAADRMMTGETMLAANSGPAPAVASQLGVPASAASLTLAPAARKRWPLVAGAGVVVAAAVVAIAMSMGGTKEPEPTPAPVAPAVNQVIVEPPPPPPAIGSAKALLGTDDRSAKSVELPPPSLVTKPPRVKPPRTRPPKVPVTAAGSAEVKTTAPPVIPAGSNTKPPPATGSGTKPVPTPF
ncbi:hypothetical protein BH11MYX3_BH11MYX3_23120 [soil metagenome]